MRSTAALALLLFLNAGVARPEVADSSANGFTVKLAFDIRATPDDVYRRLIGNVGDWWNPEHTFSGDAHNLYIEEKPTGCFCEKLPKGGAVRHLELLYLAPGSTLVFAGALGPLQSLAATGSLTIQLKASEGGTKLAASYAVAGYLPAGMNTWAGPVDGMLREQFTRLRDYVERGAKSAYKFEKVADGVYYAVAPAGGNSVVIVNDDDVLLVDTGVTPALGRELVDGIKSITSKPIRTVVNTHFHYDHTDGNQVFGPDVQIIAHDYVRTAMQTSHNRGR